MAQKKIKNNITIGFVPLGCPKAIVDSERMLAQIAQANYIITGDPNNADVVIINTCGFIEPAKLEALEEIAKALENKRKHKVGKVIVAGCLAQRLGRGLAQLAKGIDAIVTLDQRDNIANIIAETLNSKEVTYYPSHADSAVIDDKTRLLITPPHWAYLRISEGCDHRCSFCTIPAIRGPFKSKPPEHIIEEAKQLADSGVLELNIIAQDTGWYGKDMKLKNGLSVLLKQLEKIDPIQWLRLMYIYPAGITDQLIETIAQSKKIAHYLDMPIQHISDRILKDMRRPERKASIRKLIEKLRNRIPDIAMRTTVIVGFPGETEDEFNELIDFVKEIKFDALGAFTYFPETGTDAAKMPSQLPQQIKDQRFEKIMLTQQQIAFDKNRQRKGSNLKCLVDSVDPHGNAQGRIYAQAPDIDSICIIENCSAQPGQFINTHVCGYKDYDLILKQI
ncbi:MAG: 30S ribosomal protein S12 methylthiotransferase RimO [Planctomycetes bacterium]|nr:30S ribosomal protein S12 methylthiotransferase RimO [Planctomycetota bacterium]